MRFRRIACAVAVFALAPAAPEAAKDSWIALQTGQVTVLSSAGEGRTRALARRLEDFVAVLSDLPGRPLVAEVPVTVMAFRDDAAFREFRPRQNGRTLDVTGYFQRADDEHLIALSLRDTGDDFPFRVVFHEYAHALTAQSTFVWPLWLSEGLADFYSTFEVFGDQAVAGQRIPSYAWQFWGQPQRLMPIDALFRVDRASPVYAEHGQSVFYAQSWALVHYLMTFHGRPDGALWRFIDGLAAGRPPERAFDEALGADRATIEEGLRLYVKDARYASGVRFPIDRRRRRAVPPVRALGDAEAEVMLGNLLMRIGQGERADAYFARARALDARAPRLEESLGFLALNRGRYDDALTHLVQAIAQDPSNALAHYYYAETLRRQVTDQGRTLTPQVAGALVAPLRTAVRLRPGFARVHYLLGYVQLVTEADLAEGLKELETAIRLAPPNRAAMLTMASIQLKMRNVEAAARTAQAILDAPDASESIKAEARQVLDAARVKDQEPSVAGTVGM